MTTETQSDPLAMSLTLAYGLGAHGGPASEEERALFEEWMRGHCWKIGGKWNGKTYVDEAESDGYPRPQAMLTRQLWAAWRDRAALGSTEHARVTDLARGHIRRAARLEAERDQERAARQEAQRQLYAERERLYKLVSDEQVKASRLHAEIEALRRGEFICGKCGLRKDAETSGPAPF